MRKSRKEAAETRKRIDGEDGCDARSCFLAAEVDPVFATQCHRPDGVLGGWKSKITTPPGRGEGVRQPAESDHHDADDSRDEGP